MLFALSQAMAFWVIALVFWYGATLVSQLEISTQSFFIALMVWSFCQPPNILEVNITLAEYGIWRNASW
jgi:hypothetical protein